MARVMFQISRLADTRPYTDSEQEAAPGARVAGAAGAVW